MYSEGLPQIPLHAWQTLWQLRQSSRLRWEVGIWYSHRVHQDLWCGDLKENGTFIPMGYRRCSPSPSSITLASAFPSADARLLSGDTVASVALVYFLHEICDCGVRCSWQRGHNSIPFHKCLKASSRLESTLYHAFAMPVFIFHNPFTLFIQIWATFKSKDDACRPGVWELSSGPPGLAGKDFMLTNLLLCCKIPCVSR